MTVVCDCGEEMVEVFFGDVEGIIRYFRCMSCDKVIEVRSLKGKI